jgi:exopolyphosphatase/pppGpp-phosphohydrolase
MQSILDCFNVHHINTAKRIENSRKLFKIFFNEDKIKNDHLKELLYATELSEIGYKLNIYKSYEHAFYVASNSSTMR